MLEGRPRHDQTPPLRILEHRRRVAWPGRADRVHQDPRGGGIGFEGSAVGGRHGAKNLVIVTAGKYRFEERRGVAQNSSRGVRKRHVGGRDLGGSLRSGATFWRDRRRSRRKCRSPRLYE
jgi:hypothetical protein